MTNEAKVSGISRFQTEIPGLDFISRGGLPSGRTTLIAGSAGSGKSVFSAHFLADGIRNFGEGGVFVTFEENPTDIRRNMAGFGWDIPGWEAQDKWAFVDASANLEDEIISGKYDLSGLLARTEHAIRKTGAKRVALDSIGAIFSQYDSATVRRELFRLASALKRLAVTSVLTAERGEEYGAISRHGVEEFVADNAIILRNVIRNGRRRRTIEILKLRGLNHLKGEFPYTVTPDEGIVIIPLAAIQMKGESSNLRVTSGERILDEMCGGGFFQGSTVLVAGTTGTGKSLITCQFISGGLKDGERCLLLAFEESKEQIFRNAGNWGFDLQAMEERGTLRVISEYPETATLEDHLIRIKKEIETYKPHRLAIDSLSALERIGTPASFSEFCVALSSFLRGTKTTALYTAATKGIDGGVSVTDLEISTVTDTIIVLRYVEIQGQMRRAISVLKMRGSQHEKEIRDITIDSGGIHIGEPIRNVTGMIVGQPRQVASGNGPPDAHPLNQA